MTAKVEKMTTADGAILELSVDAGVCTMIFGKDSTSVTSVMTATEVQAAADLFAVAKELM